MDLRDVGIKQATPLLTWVFLLMNQEETPWRELSLPFVDSKQLTCYPAARERKVRAWVISSAASL